MEENIREYGKANFMNTIDKKLAGAEKVQNIFKIIRKRL